MATSGGAITDDFVFGAFDGAAWSETMRVASATKSLQLKGALVAGGSIGSSGGTLGYAPGGGGSVVQTTSKSTRVKLDKPSGQITTSASMLNAGEVALFAVDNALVSATDTINLSLAGGNAAPSTYRYWIEAVANGSFTIAIENRSAGALAEALLFNFALLKAVNA
jgi:hypothetical protein